MRQPSLDEATTLVAQLESCEAGSSADTLGTHLPGCQDGGPGLAALGPGSTGLVGGVWAQRSAGDKACL